MKDTAKTRMMTPSPLLPGNMAAQIQAPATLPSPRLLMPIVQKVVGEVSDQALVPVATASRGLAFQPRSLLTLLTYCYAMGTYASQKVEAELRNDSLLRFLRADELPDWQILCGFRRCNGEVLLKCLEQTLHLAWAAQEKMFGRAEQDIKVTSELLDDHGLRDLAAKDAAGRIEQAVWLDSVALNQLPKAGSPDL
jgi:hypothetical protein